MQHFIWDIVGGVVCSVVSGPPVQVWRVVRVCRRTVPPLPSPPPSILSSPHTCNLCQSLGIAQTRPTGTTTTYIVIVFSFNLLFHINLICPLSCQALSSSGREVLGKLWYLQVKNGRINFQKVQKLTSVPTPWGKQIYHIFSDWNLPRANIANKIISETLP